MTRVMLASMQSQSPAGGLSHGLLLALAVVLLLMALRMAGRALAPLGEVLRALAAAGGTVLLLLLALSLIVVSLFTTQ
jgi:multisubunit Na+/H+ antiporter MnhB subunit